MGVVLTWWQCCVILAKDFLCMHRNAASICGVILSILEQSLWVALSESGALFCVFFCNAEIKKNNFYRLREGSCYF